MSAYRPGQPPPDLEPPERPGFGPVDPVRVAVLVAIGLPIVAALAVLIARCRG